MVLDARRRSAIYQELVPLIGDDNANALMSEFPSYDGDELVTKAMFRSELRAELAELESRLTLRLGAALAGQTTIMLAAFALLR